KFLARLCAFALIIAMLVPANVSRAATYDPDVNFKGKTVILHTNDVHGAIASYTYTKALKATYERAGADVILVDAGDYSQGDPTVSVYKGLSAIKLMNKAHYDVATLGNHEFDYGWPQLKKNLKKAKFTVVCADVLQNGKVLAGTKANTVIKTSSGLKVGFFGMETPEAQTKTNPALIKGLTFLAGEDMYKCAQAQVDELKEKADVIICLSHLGVDPESKPNRSYDLLANTTGIDFLIDGHSHTVMEKGENGEKIQSTGSKFENIGVIVIDNKTKKIEDNYLIAVDETLPTSKLVTKKANKYTNKIEELYGTVFAKSEVDLNGEKAPGNRTEETNNGDLITDAMIWQVMQNKEGLAVDLDHVVAITNGGGIRAAIAAGDITRKDVLTVLPFGNTITLVYVTGAELLEALEASCQSCPEALGGFPQIAGMKITIDTTKEYKPNADTYPGSTYYGPKKITRVTINDVNGKKFNKKDVYAVITNNFLAAGGDTYYAFAAASGQFDTGVPLDEAVMAYITEELGGVIGTDYAKPQGRITVK
ncbi:MAG: bifunctional metallophosphatase/5'-nucleotidase, partial [Lachnospiraceae bacterium]|nr:bifunctional metallophosphatase/5'-nucleotidase [Lachnospiraceae bacterium]